MKQQRKYVDHMTVQILEQRSVIRKQKKDAAPNQDADKTEKKGAGTKINFPGASTSSATASTTKKRPASRDGLASPMSSVTGEISSDDEKSEIRFEKFEKAKNTPYWALQNSLDADARKQSKKDTNSSIESHVAAAGGQAKKKQKVVDGTARATDTGVQSGAALGVDDGTKLLKTLHGYLSYLRKTFTKQGDLIAMCTASGVDSALFSRLSMAAKIEMTLLLSDEEIGCVGKLLGLLNKKEMSNKGTEGVCVVMPNKDKYLYFLNYRDGN